MAAITSHSDFWGQEEEIRHYFHLSPFYLPCSNGAGCHDFSFLIFSLKLALGSVQLISHFWLFATPWTAARQSSLSITNPRSLPKLMSIESAMPFNHLILCRPLLLLPSIFPSIRVFPMSQLFTSSGQSIGVSAPASVLPMNIQDWFPLGQTGWSFLLSKRHLRVFSNTTVQKHQFFSAQLSL